MAGLQELRLSDRVLIRLNLVSEIDGLVFRGTGISSSLQFSFIKALSELGEDIIFFEHKMVSSCGLAGGLFVSAAAERAKTEALERDSLLYHYRSGMAFLPICDTAMNISPLRAFSLLSACPPINVVLVTDDSRCTGASDCLIFGTGASKTKTKALENALHEYLSQKENHEKNPTWCGSLEQSTDALSNPDFHHLASRDIRNIAKFKLLCESRDNVVADIPKREHALNWEIEYIPSPIRFFKYVRASSHSLLTLRPRLEESGATEAKPLFAPFS